MKKILMTLVMLAPMTVAAEGGYMQQQSPQEYLDDKQQTQQQAGLSEVEKRRLSRAIDAMVRNFYYGAGIIYPLFSQENERLIAEGRSELDAAITTAPILVAGFQQILSNMRPYMNDLRGYKVTFRENGEPLISRSFNPAIETMENGGHMVAENVAKEAEEYIEWGNELLAKAGLTYDVNDPYAQLALSELEKKMPPRGAFEVK